MKGKVWLVGAGPGDPGLLTLKGKETLQQATVVVYDRLVSEAILWTIPPEARLINVGKSSGNHPVPQEEINRILLEEALRGEQVVRLKGGDPYLFGRGGEEVQILTAKKIPVEVISGISSALAVPANACIPLTHRDLSSSVHIITWQRKEGTPTDEALTGLSQAGGSLVILMGSAALKDISVRLIKAGFNPDLPAAIISQGSSPQQRTWITALNRMGETADFEGLVSPALIVIGHVCSLGKPTAPSQIQPVEAQAQEARLQEKNSPDCGNRTLEGIRIVVTRPEPGNADLCRRIRELGGEALPIPCIKTIPLENDAGPLFSERFTGWIVFTSSTGVDMFFDQYLCGGGDLRSFSACRFAAIGPATAEALKWRGFIADHVPQVYNGRSLGEELVKKINPKEQILLIRPRQGAPDLGEILSNSGASFRELTVYDTVPAVIGDYARQVIGEGRFDYLFFTSPSAVSTFRETFGKNRGDFLQKPVKAVCIGEGTAKKAQEYGMETYVPAEASTNAMVQLLCDLIHNKKGNN
ncbi:uroporphyrinogen-III synthase/methyltransferase [Treponema primitia ZAS-2]|uniref:uroporphyrinogen-III C-methyltransferase n=1 Tax=Treponema primitia (strain ATCC BAA-887 / DSM 12427 / ZAS-2) TaxID=545694 RepID=F5YLI5_TREPZ|nr:uroporphyrinogen-III C-methyltransferase [Treponema primitia]AEF85381.1 uroporphyrinogen-III synthase/methyltransferase [Treponema primitia ZAS-2]